MISVIVTSRVEGNVNHNIEELIRSLKEHSRRPDDLELLIKFDDDDDKAYELSKDLARRPLPFSIKMARGPRNRGYIDIHQGYNFLMPLLHSKCNIVIAMADDFRAEQDWDHMLRQAAMDSGEFFILHQRPHPLPREEFVKALKEEKARNPFNMTVDMFDGGDLFIIDEAPAWSPALLKACQFSTPLLDSPFPVSFTDAWTLCLEWCLWNTHGINITRFMPNTFISRKTCEVDQPTNERWNTDRKTNFDYIASTQFRMIVAHQAKEIACHLKQEATLK